MKIALFWHVTALKEIELAVGIVNNRQKEFNANSQSVITCGVFPENKAINYNINGLDRTIVYEPSPDNLNIVNILNTAFQFAKENEVTFGVFSNSSAWILDSRKLYYLLKQKEVETKAFSLRVGDISGKATNFSSKLPFIDDNFIILNVKRCDELGVFEKQRLRSFTSQFEEWGGNHASLISFFEACVPYGDIHIYSDGSDCQNLYGEFNKFYPTPYQYSYKYGFLLSDPYIDHKVHALRAELLDRLGIREESLIKAYINKHKKKPYIFYFKQDIPFLKKGIFKRIFEIFIKYIKGFSNKISYEFQKGYDKARRY